MSNKPSLCLSKLINSLQSATGGTLLELAIALPTLLSVGFLLLDHALPIRAHNALYETVDAGLRCLTTTGSSCAPSASLSAQRSFTLLETTPQHRVPVVRINAVGKIHSAPIFEYTKHATELLSWSTRTPGTPLIATYQKRATSVPITPFRRHLPLVTGDNPRTPKIIYANGETNPHAVYDRDISFADNSTQSFTLPVPAPYPGATATNEVCVLESTRGDLTPCGVFPWRAGTSYGAGSQSWEVPDTIGISEFSEITYGLLVISGSAADNGSTVTGKVHLQAQQPRGVPYYLGAQSIVGKLEFANFYPRGASFAQLSEAIRDNPLYTGTGSELRMYQAIALQPGKPLRITLRTEKIAGNGSFKWRFKRAELYLPRYTKAATRAVPCPGAQEDSCNLSCNLAHLGLSNITRPVITTSNSQAGDTSGACVDPRLVSTLLQQPQSTALGCLTYTPTTSGSSCMQRTQSGGCIAGALARTDQTLAESCGVPVQLRSEQSLTVTSAPRKLSHTVHPVNCADIERTAAGYNAPSEWASLTGSVSTKKIGTQVVSAIGSCSGYTTTVFDLSTCKRDLARGVSGIFVEGYLELAGSPTLEQMHTEAVACGMHPTGAVEHQGYSTVGVQLVTSSEATHKYPAVAVTSETPLGNYPMGEIPPACLTGRCLSKELPVPIAQSHHQMQEQRTTAALTLMREQLKTFIPEVQFHPGCESPGACAEITVTHQPATATQGKTVGVRATIHQPPLLPFLGTSSRITTYAEERSMERATIE